jgi:hypothetical protein
MATSAQEDRVASVLPIFPNKLLGAVSKVCDLSVMVAKQGGLTSKKELPA